jgi:hypothetical protein
MRSISARIAAPARRGLLLGATLLLSASIAMACGSSDKSNGDAAGDNQPGQQTLNVQVASYDLVANQNNRFIAGVLTMSNDFVSYGTVQMRFSYLGDGKTQQTPRFFEEDTGSFLQIPGEGVANPPDVPTAGPASDGRGVYAVEPIKFDQAGFWQVDVIAKTKDGQLQGSAAFPVSATAVFPAPGQKAIPSDSLTVNSTDVPQAAIDSRATGGNPIPDVALHQLSIADALKQDKPLVIVFATPVFCISQFCGPVTDMIAGLQQQYGDKANFIHVEIWKDFQAKQINSAAQDWLYRNGDLYEPWVFLVDKDGTIVNRWDNVATRDEVETALKALLSS